MSLILGKAVPAQGKPDLSEKAERAFMVASERREEKVRAELREKIAAGVEEWAGRQDAVATAWAADASSQLGSQDAGFRKGCEARVHDHAEFARQLREFAARIREGAVS